LTEPRRILFVHANDELYGSDLILVSLLRTLDRSRFAPSVVLSSDIDTERLLSRELESMGVRTRRMRLAVLRRKYFTLLGLVRFTIRFAVSTLRLAALIWRERVDLVHSHTAAVLPGAAAAWLTGKRHVWHISEIVVRPRALHRMLQWLVPRLSDTVVSISYAVQEHLLSGGARESTFIVIHNGLDARSFATGNGARVRVELGIEPERPLVGLIGRVGSWKGQELLCEAAALVVRERPDTMFLLVGGVHDRQTRRLDALRARVAALRIDANVRISDFRRDIPDVLAALDLYAHPTTDPEPFGMTVLEAMASGKAVIAADHGGPREIVVHGETGVLVAPRDPRALADAILALLADPERCRRMGEAGRRRAQSHFSLEAFAAGYDQLYGHLTQGIQRAHALSAARGAAQ
jgi:glycosyltransferase involved in cell wall biosynthesis